MELEKYLSEEDNNALKGVKNTIEIDEKQLFDKKNMAIVSIFLGVLGVDRFVLGDKIRGILKGLVFLGLLISLIVMVNVIGGKTMEFIFQNGTTGESYTFVWADNVAVVGQNMANVVYCLAAVLGVYIVFAIVDGVLCYRKNMKNNYNQIKKALNEQ